jgi:CDP-glucose 4,6-dehydratase
VTGHTGFKGAWLALWLEQLGARTVGYALAPPTQPNLFEMAQLAAGMTSIEGDVRDGEALQRALSESGAEIVIHLAAQALVRPGYQDPTATFETNVLGTLRLLDSVRACESVRAVVVVTSDKCYEPRDDGRPLVETDPLGGRDPYSASKAAAEILTRSYRESFFSTAEGARPVAVATARAGNVVGGGDWSEDRLVPDIVRALSQSRAVELRHPAAVRPWQHVLEPLAGYLLLAERLHEGGQEFAGAWNFAPADEDAWPVGRLVAKIHAAWGVPFRWVEQAGPRPHETAFLRLDASRAHDQLGWRPRFRIEETIDRLTAWYRRAAAGEDPRDLSLEEIRTYGGLS